MYEFFWSVLPCRRIVELIRCCPKKTRLIVKKDSLDEKAGPVVKQSSQTFASTAAKIYKEEGLKGFFKGVIPALVLVINPVIQFTAFERLKVVVEKTRSLTTFDFFVLGALSKLLATGLTYPYM